MVTTKQGGSLRPVFFFFGEAFAIVLSECRCAELSGIIGSSDKHVTQRKPTAQR